MRKYLLVLVLSGAGWGQWVSPPTSGYSTLNTFLGSLIATQSGAGAASGNCTAGKDLYLDTTNHVEYFCSATNTWLLLGGIPVATAATASTLAERNASGELIALNTVATGKTAMATDTNLAIGQVPDALITPVKLHASTIDSQTDGSTVTWAIGSVLNAQGMLTFTVHSGSRTLNITNPVIGGNYVLKLIQDGTGGEGLTLGTGCTWKVAGGGSGAVTLTNAANALDVLTFIYDGSNCLATLIPNLN